MSVFERPKVFFVGLEATGGLENAQQLQDTLGLKLTHSNALDWPRILRRAKIFTSKISYDFEIFCENPWSHVFREMHQLWPNAKFVLTTRESQDWLDHMQDRWGGTPKQPTLELIYGATDPVAQPDVFLDKLASHTQAVRSYFAAEPEELLELDYDDAQSSQKLMAFLNLDADAKSQDAAA